MIDYVDASALTAVILKEPQSRLVDVVLRESSSALLLSDLCLAECSSAIALAVRRNALDPQVVKGLWDQLDAWVGAFAERIATQAADVRSANELVRHLHLKLRGPDAIHLAATARLGARLITLDRRMADAARALGVACINPAESSA